MQRDQLPDDTEALKTLLIGRQELIEKLMTEIARLRRWRFGRSSERTDAVLMQLQLLLEGMQAPVGKTPAPQTEERIPAGDSKEPADKERAKRPARKRGQFPAHFPRETILHGPHSCLCPDCGAKMRTLGEDVSEQLDFVPGYFKVLRHVRPKLSCGNCSRVVQLPAPVRPIERGLPTPALMAHVMVSKYADHTPLYRMQAQFGRAGLPLERSLLGDWVAAGSSLSDPLVDALGRYVLAGGKIHGDDTPVPVLDPGRGKTKTGRIWAYVRDDRPAASTDPPAVWYRYSPDRKGEHPRGHLTDFRGVLQADGYSGFSQLYETGRILEAACMAHARRKFYDIYKQDGSPIAIEAIKRIRALYAIERQIRGQQPQVRRVARQQLAGPLLEDLHAWLAHTLHTVSMKSALA